MGEKEASPAKFSGEELKQLQSLPLDVKIIMTKQRIKWWLDKYDAYISFSGGKDSTVLLDLARSVRKDIPAVFVDTGLEYPEVREFALSHDNVIRLRPEMSFRKVIEVYGYPLISKDVAKQIRTARNGTKNAVMAFDGKNVSGEETWFRQRYKKWKYLFESDIPISEQCCDVMKKKPAKQYEKETGRKPIVATMACESHNRKKVWLQNGCNAYDSIRPISRPMSFWTEHDVLQYIFEKKLAYASVYGNIVRDENGKFSTTQLSRTGCVFCAFGCHLEKEPNRFQLLKQTHPSLWDYCMKDWSRGGWA